MESVQYLPALGVNLFNMGFDTDLNLLKELTQNKVTMLGNIPPEMCWPPGVSSENMAIFIEAVRSYQAK